MKPDDFKFRKQYKIAVIKEIKKLRNEGATFKEIADFFNSKKMETFTGNGIWYSQTIHKLVK